MAKKKAKKKASKKKAAKKTAKRRSSKKVGKRTAKRGTRRPAGKKKSKKTAKKKAKKKARRTVMYSSTGKKLYAKRNASGQFKDIQQYARAHRMDMARSSQEEAAAAEAAPAPVM